MHKTTANYNPDVRPNGAMVSLLDPWKSRGWDCFDDGGRCMYSTMASMMNCPACAAALAPSGRLTIVPEPEKVKTQAEINQEKIKATQSDVEKIPAGFPCPECGKICKSKFGLGSHMRMHKR